MVELPNDMGVWYEAGGINDQDYGLVHWYKAVKNYRATFELDEYRKLRKEMEDGKRISGQGR